jgi:hypothetical protein
MVKTFQKVFSAVLICLLLLCATVAFSQKYEVGLGVGGMTYTGDMVRDYHIENNRPGGMLFFRYNVNDYLSLRGNFMGGALYGNDKKPIDAFADARNAPDFTIPAIELAGMVEYYFLDYKENINLLRWSPYFFIGLGATWFGAHENPTGSYSSIQPVIPMGLGFKYLLRREWSIGIEGGARKTFFDYIDNLSEGDLTNKNLQYGNGYDKDWYYFVGFTVSYTFYTIPCPYGFQ